MDCAHIHKVIVTFYLRSVVLPLSPFYCTISGETRKSLGETCAPKGKIILQGDLTTLPDLAGINRRAFCKNVAEAGGPAAARKG